MRIEKGEKTQKRSRFCPAHPKKSLLNKSAESKRLHRCDLISLFISPFIPRFSPSFRGGCCRHPRFSPLKSLCLSSFFINLFLLFSCPPFFPSFLFLNSKAFGVLSVPIRVHFKCKLSARTWGGDEK